MKMGDLASPQMPYKYKIYKWRGRGERAGWEPDVCQMAPNKNPKLLIKKNF